MTTEQFLIDSLSDTFARRCDELIAQDKLSDAHSIYEEWVVNGVDPEGEEYEWQFITNLTTQE